MEKGAEKVGKTKQSWEWLSDGQTNEMQILFSQITDSNRLVEGSAKPNIDANPLLSADPFVVINLSMRSKSLPRAFRLLLEFRFDNISIYRGSVSKQECFTEESKKRGKVTKFRKLVLRRYIRWCKLEVGYLQRVRPCWLRWRTCETEIKDGEEAKVVSEEVWYHPL